MHKRLSTAVMITYGRRSDYVIPVIEDVIKEADVARATFYAHFDSIEHAINTVGEAMVEEMLQSMSTFFHKSEDPLTRIVTGVQIFLLRCVTEPLWGAFVSRTTFLSRDASLLQVVGADLTEGKRAKLIKFDEVEAATSLLIGTMMDAIRHLVKTDDRSRAYVNETTSMILQGLGVERNQARKIVSDRGVVLRGLAPDYLPWWKDPWRSY